MYLAADESVRQGGMNSNSIFLDFVKNDHTCQLFILANDF